MALIIIFIVHHTRNTLLCMKIRLANDTHFMNAERADWDFSSTNNLFANACEGRARTHQKIYCQCSCTSPMNATHTRQQSHTLTRILCYIHNSRIAISSLCLIYTLISGLFYEYCTHALWLHKCPMVSLLLYSFVVNTPYIMVIPGVRLLFIVSHVQLLSANRFNLLIY